MRSDATRNVHADSSNLGFRRDSSIRPLSLLPSPEGMRKSAQVRIRTSSNLRTYSTAPKLFRLPSDGKTTKVEDRIADELSWPVEGHIATTITFEKLDAPLREQFR